MPRRDWEDGQLGDTPLSAARLNTAEDDIEGAILQAFRDPTTLWVGAIQRNDDGVPISAAVKWPDGITGNYWATASTAFPGAIDTYSITRAVTPMETYTQPLVTRDPDNGLVIYQPAVVKEVSS